MFLGERRNKDMTMSGKEFLRQIYWIKRMIAQWEGIKLKKYKNKYPVYATIFWRSYGTPIDVPLKITFEYYSSYKADTGRGIALEYDIVFDNLTSAQEKNISTLDNIESNIEKVKRHLLKRICKKEIEMGGCFAIPTWRYI